jgi:hypothetical protein
MVTMGIAAKKVRTVFHLDTRNSAGLGIMAAEQRGPGAALLLAPSPGDQADDAVRHEIGDRFRAQDAEDLAGLPKGQGPEDRDTGPGSSLDRQAVGTRIRRRRPILWPCMAIAVKREGRNALPSSSGRSRAGRRESPVPFRSPTIKVVAETQANPAPQGGDPVTRDRLCGCRLEQRWELGANSLAGADEVLAPNLGRQCRPNL